MPFISGERTIYPDGVLEASRAGRTGTWLVEVKTGSSLKTGASGFGRSQHYLSWADVLTVAVETRRLLTVAGLVVSWDGADERLDTSASTSNSPSGADGDGRRRDS
ncbi:MAG: hypothetical protein M3Q48_03730 [Actinomycetota bacterium]|nr:hypothetical protein [Actinomycetota bacterium]